MKTKNLLFILLVVIGALTMATEEGNHLSLDLFSSAFAIIVIVHLTRSYLIIKSPEMREYGHSKLAKGWIYGSTLLLATYIYILSCVNESGLDLYKPDVEWLLIMETANLLLVGLEIYYSHLKGEHPLVATVKQLNTMIENLKDEHSKTLQEHKAKFKEQDGHISDLKTRLTNQESKTQDLETSVEVIEDELVRTKQDLEQVQKRLRVVEKNILQRITVDQHKFAIGCPNCGKIHVIGNATKERICCNNNLLALSS